MQGADSLEKTLMLGKIEGKRRSGQQRMSWLDSITNSMDMNLSKRQETAKDRVAWRAAIHRVTKSRTRLGNWTTATFPIHDLERILLLCPFWHTSGPRALLGQWSVSRSSTCFSQAQVVSHHSVHCIHCIPFPCLGVMWAHVETSVVSPEWLMRRAPRPYRQATMHVQEWAFGFTEIWGLFVIKQGGAHPS